MSERSLIPGSRSAPDVVDLRASDDEKDAHVSATLQALDEGRLAILGGRLPDDALGGRTGKPDVLLRDATGSYHPGDVKAHLVLDKRKSGDIGMFVCWTRTRDQQTERVWSYGSSDGHDAHKRVFSGQRQEVAGVAGEDRRGLVEPDGGGRD